MGTLLELTRMHFVDFSETIMFLDRGSQIFFESGPGRFESTLVIWDCAPNPH